MNSVITEPFTDTRGRILHAAAAEFAANGFRGATMSSIARRAHLNEVTIYRHFATKQELHWEAIDSKLRHSNFFGDILDVVAGVQAPVDLLRLLGETIIAAIEYDPSVARLLYLTMMELGPEQKLLVEIHVQPFVTAVRGRIESWIKAGEIRPINAETGATIIMGMLLTHCAMRSLLGVSNGQFRSPREFAAEYADICMFGLQSDLT
jgi:AcrR family transcriptional regulator